MKIVIDNEIPYISESIEKVADEVVYLPGNAITADDVKDADALIVRTRTKCNRQLLEGSKVRFIATATIGYDHIDTEYCHENGITWANAPGCNSSSVAQYIESTFIILETEYEFPLNGKTLGIVGAGNVGTKIKALAESFGMKVLLNDPPRAEKEGKSGFVDLEDIIKYSDVISFHTPLTLAGPYKTFHLVDDDFFKQLERRPVIINTSRGEVVETNALLSAIDNKSISYTVIDVWENEPGINPILLEKANISTPHIAGYSADGKANATRMALDALCRYFNIPADFEILPPPPYGGEFAAETMEYALLKIYDPRVDSYKLKVNPGWFEGFRDNYPLRREKEAYTIKILE